MIIQEKYWEFQDRGHRSVKVQVDRKIYEQELRQDFCNELTRTADGGLQLNSLEEDEFGNETRVKVTISKMEIDFIVEQIKKGLL